MSADDVSWGIGPTFATGKFGLIRAPLQLIAAPDSLGFRLQVGVSILTEGGFPDDREAVQLAEIEEDLLATVAGGLFLGVVTSAGQRDFYWYVPSNHDTWTTAVAERHVHHNLSSTVTADPQHRTAEALCRAANFANEDRLAVDELVANGADLQARYPTEHYLYFPSEEQAQSAAADLAGDAAADVEVSASEDGSWLLTYSLTGYVNYHAIASDRSTFTRVASHFGGSYDGWGVALAD
jgi:regulator of RNase E activity RraB